MNLTPEQILELKILHFCILADLVATFGFAQIAYFITKKTQSEFKRKYLPVDIGDYFGILLLSTFVGAAVFYGLHYYLICKYLK